MFNEKINKKGLKHKFIANHLKINVKTFYNWRHFINIEMYITFAKFLKMLDISIDEFLAECEKRKI